MIPIIVFINPYWQHSVFNAVDELLRNVTVEFWNRAGPELKKPLTSTQNDHNLINQEEVYLWDFLLTSCTDLHFSPVHHFCFSTHDPDLPQNNKSWWRDTRKC